MLAVIAHHFVEGSHPAVGACGTKGIDTEARKEGPARRGLTLVVVDKGGLLKLATLDPAAGCGRGRRSAGRKARRRRGEFVTYELAVTNRTVSDPQVDDLAGVLGRLPDDLRVAGPQGSLRPQGRRDAKGAGVGEGRRLP